MVGIHSHGFAIHGFNRDHLHTFRGVGLELHTRLDLIHTLEGFAWHIVYQLFVVLAVSFSSRHVNG